MRAERRHGRSGVGEVVAPGPARAGKHAHYGMPPLTRQEPDGLQSATGGKNLRWTGFRPPGGSIAEADHRLLPRPHVQALQDLLGVVPDRVGGEVEHPRNVGRRMPWASRRATSACRGLRPNRCCTLSDVSRRAARRSTASTNHSGSVMPSSVTGWSLTRLLPRTALSPARGTRINSPLSSLTSSPNRAHTSMIRSPAAGSERHRERQRCLSGSSG